MTYFRSWNIPAGTGNGTFYADVASILGVQSRPDGSAMLLTMCNGEPEHRGSILGPNGMPAATGRREGDGRWQFEVVPEHGTPPGLLFVRKQKRHENGTAIEGKYDYGVIRPQLAGHMCLGGGAALVFVIRVPEEPDVELSLQPWPGMTPNG